MEFELKQRGIQYVIDNDVIKYLPSVAKLLEETPFAINVYKNVFLKTRIYECLATTPYAGYFTYFGMFYFLNPCEHPYDWRPYPRYIPQPLRLRPVL